MSTHEASFARIDGDLRRLTDGALEKSELLTWLKSQINKERFEILETKGDVDFSFEVGGRYRFRASAFHSRGHLAIALRLLNDRIPNFNEIGLPEKPRLWSKSQTGLVIVTGPTGSGKSTTIASMVNEANQNRDSHILTIEDPVEYLFPEGRGLVRHREIGIDAPNFPRAIRAALREDVDILVIGEMRDQETISAAITVAETGHLVFATLHTSGAAQAVDRIVDAFDSSAQPLIRSRLSACLIGVVYQRLLKLEPHGRIAAFEVLASNYGVKNLIREGKTHQIPNLMTTNRSDGMQTM
ncbi:MAG: type IV pilus twitching motility protein PilT, partial [Candidatus Nanopelagicaceae bacterium]